MSSGWSASTLLALLVLSSCSDPAPFRTGPGDDTITVRGIEDFSVAFDRARIECDETWTEPAVPENIPLETFTCDRDGVHLVAAFADSKLERRLIRVSGADSPEVFLQGDNWAVRFPDPEGIKELRRVIGGSITRAPKQPIP
jgi:hypothetical protein